MPSRTARASRAQNSDAPCIQSLNASTRPVEDCDWTFQCVTQIPPQSHALYVPAHRTLMGKRVLFKAVEKHCSLRCEIIKFGCCGRNPAPVLARHTPFVACDVSGDPIRRRAIFTSSALTPLLAIGIVHASRAGLLTLPTPRAPKRASVHMRRTVWFLSTAIAVRRHSKCRSFTFDQEAEFHRYRAAR
jgi:hypothetical protein